MNKPETSLIPSSEVRKILGGVCEMTLQRWAKDEKYNHLNFPKPIKIATRNYWKRSAVESWIEQQAAA